MTDIFENFETDQLKSIRHNETDFEQFKEFHKTVEARHESAVRSQKRDVLVRRLKQWDIDTAGRWQYASLTKLRENYPAAVDMVQETVDATNHPSSFFIVSTDAFQGTYMAYAIARRYIGHDKASPSRIVRLSEDDLLGFANGGFAGRDALTRLLNRKNTLYIVDNCGARPEYTETRELPVLEQFLSHVYSHDKTAILVSQISLDGYAELYSESGQSRLHGLFGKSQIDLRGGEQDQDEQDGNSNVNFGLFDG